MRSSPRLTNVFYAFKGSAAREERGGRDSVDESQLGLAREAQLEDNVTKALVNTLVHSDAPVRERFLALAGVPPLAASDPRHIHFAMQRSVNANDPVLAQPRRVLLGIVPHGQVNRRAPAGSRPSSTNERRPDAWIWSSDFAVLVEAKVAGPLDAEQWRDHRKRLCNGRAEPVTERELSWKDIHEALSPLLADEALSDRSRWLLSQFLEYLSLENVMGFTGISNEVFDYFFQPGEEETRLAVKRTISSFANELQAEVEQINPWYSGHKVGTLKSTDSYCWVAFGPQTPEHDPAFKYSAHVTVSTTSGGVDVFINIELQAAVDKLRQAIAAQRPAVLESLRALGVGQFEIRLEEREQVHGATWRALPVSTTRLDYLFDERVGEALSEILFSSIMAIRRPCVAIATTISRKGVREAQGNGPRGIVEKVASIVALLDPIVRLINEQA